jgi:alcohol dehydrogenase, propanol-preferring
MAAQVARVLGHVTIVGLGGGALPVNLVSPPHECSVASRYWGFITELMDVVSLAQAGKVRMLVEHFPLERAGETYCALFGGPVRDIWPLRDRPGTPRVGGRTWQRPVRICSG